MKPFYRACLLPLRNNYLWNVSHPYGPPFYERRRTSIEHDNLKAFRFQIYGSVPSGCVLDSFITWVVALSTDGCLLLTKTCKCIYFSVKFVRRFLRKTTELIFSILLKKKEIFFKRFSVFKFQTADRFYFFFRVASTFFRHRSTNTYMPLILIS